MKIVEFAIENFRGIYSLPPIQVQKLNVFIGRNNAGKSTILDALFIALKNISHISSTILSKPVDNYSEQLLKLWFFGNHQKPAVIRVKLELDEEERVELSEFSGLEDTKYAELDIHLTYKNGHVEWALQKLNLAGHVFPSIIQKTNKVYKSVTKQDLQGYTPEKIVEKTRVLNDKAFSKFLEISKDKIFRLTPYVFVNKEEEENVGIEGLLRPLLLPSEMINCLQWLNNAEARLKSRFYNLLEEVTPYRTYYVEGHNLLKQWEFMTLRTECFGSGEQLIEGLLATLINISHKYKGCIVMLEEPEVHLHPGYVRRLARILRRFIEEEEIQIFVVTQSPDLLRVIDWDSVFVVRLEKRYIPSLGLKLTTTIERLGKDKLVAEQLASDLGIPVGELAFVDALILVEGKADEDILSRCIQILTERGMLHNLGFYNLRFHKIAQLNKDSAIKLATEFFKNQTIVIADGDEEGNKTVEIAKRYGLRITENVFQWSVRDILHLFDGKMLTEAIKSVIDSYMSKIKEKNAQKRIEELLESIEDRSALTRDVDPLRDLANIIIENLDEIRYKYKEGKEKEFYYMLKAAIARALVSKMRRVPPEIERVLSLIDRALARGRDV